MIRFVFKKTTIAVIMTSQPTTKNTSKCMSLIALDSIVFFALLSAQNHLCKVIDTAVVKSFEGLMFNRKCFHYFFISFIVLSTVINMEFIFVNPHRVILINIIIRKSLLIRRY